jgi:hypothetical protein
MSELDADALSEYAYLWDGSDPGWAVHSHYHHQEAVRILLPENGVDLHFVKTLRSLSPDIAHEPPAALRDRLEIAGCFDCGIMESRDAYALRRKCAEAGIIMASEGCSLVIHRLVNERRNSALLIEDEALAFALGEEALRRGVPSRHSTN